MSSISLIHDMASTTTYLALDRHVAAVIWFLLGAIVAGGSGLAVLEGVLYLLSKDPITSYVRNWRNGHAWAAIAIGLALVTAVAVGFTHFILDG